MIYLDNSATTLIKPPQVAQAVYDAIIQWEIVAEGLTIALLVHQ